MMTAQSDSTWGTVKAVSDQLLDEMRQIRESLDRIEEALSTQGQPKRQAPTPEWFKIALMDEVIDAGGELLLDGSQTMHRYARHLKPWARLALIETVAGLSVVDGMITLRH